MTDKLLPLPEPLSLHGSYRDWFTADQMHAYARAHLAAQQAEPVTVPDAMNVVIAALRDDPDYAWSWHCNVAMAAFDEGLSHYAANKAAARFLRALAGVETTEHPGFPSPTPQAVPMTDQWRLLNSGEQIQAGDEALQDDCVTWVSLVGWEVGTSYNPSILLPMRRRAEAPHGITQPQQEGDAK